MPFYVANEKWITVQNRSSPYSLMTVVLLTHNCHGNGTRTQQLNFDSLVLAYNEYKLCHQQSCSFQVKVASSLHAILKQGTE